MLSLDVTASQWSMATVVLKPEDKDHGNLGLGLLALMFSDTDFRNPTTCERRHGAHAEAIWGCSS